MKNFHVPIATHLIDEVTNLFEEVIILKDNHVHTNANVADLMQTYFTLEGSVDAIEPFVNKYKVLDIETFGQRKIVHFRGPLQPEEHQLLKQNDVQLQDIPLQKLFVLLTEKETKHVR